MPDADLSNYPIVEDFLRGEQQRFIFGGNGQFSAITSARNFATYYGGLKAGYSADMVGAGVGKQANVIITKTRAYHEYSLKIHKSQLPLYIKEKNKLKEILGMFLNANAITPKD